MTYSNISEIASQIRNSIANNQIVPFYEDDIYEVNDLNLFVRITCLENNTYKVTGRDTNTDECFSLYFGENATSTERFVIEYLINEIKFAYGNR